MINAASGKIFRVFIASPSDLSDERQAARRVIDRINRVLAGGRIDWRVELLAWEDTLPGYARPQEIINQEVDVCNMFVGLLWKRWGQPTGKFSSGFEEEFTRARDRRLISEEPEIWIFLKGIEKSLLDDPGEQLQKTLNFRQRLQESREVLYKEFNTGDEWEKTFFDLLLQHILKNITPSLAAQPETPKSPSVSSAEVATDLDKPDLSVIDFPQELDKAIGKMRKAIEQNVSIEKTDISRIYLASFSLISSFTNEVLGTHEINLVYLFRKKYQLLEREKTLIFRSIIADQYSYYPGWYWLSDSNTLDYRARLAFHALFDNNLTVRRKSLEILAVNKILDMSPVFTREEFLPRILDSDNSKEIISASLDYLSSTGTMDDMPLLEQFINDQENENYDKALLAYLSIIARDNIDAAFKLVLEKIRVNANEWVEIFRDQKSFIEADLLQQGLHHLNKYVRYFTVQELYYRNAISAESAKILKNDDWAPIREVAFRVLIKLGETVEPSEIKNSFKGATSTFDSHLYPLYTPVWNPPVDAEGVLFELFSTYPDERLNELIYDFLSDGHVAYKAFIHKRFDEISDSILNDLVINLRELLQELVKRIRERWGEAGNEFADKVQGELGEYIVNEYVASALSVISDHEDNKFVEVARTYLDSKNDKIKYYSLQILGKFGNENDVENIVRIGKQSNVTGIKLLAAKTALALSTNQIEILTDFLSSKDTDFIKASLDTLMPQDKDQIDHVLRSLLYSDHDVTRLSVIYYLTNKLRKDELIDLLESYLSKDHYYYDVVCWLDRSIYSPKALWPNFLDQLKAKLN